MKSTFSKILGFTGNILKYGCITHCTFEYIGDFVVCSGPSMEPTLRTNDILLTERVSPRLSKISKGDIIIAKCPTDPRQHICKRVTGLAGEKIVRQEAYSGSLLMSAIKSLENDEYENQNADPGKKTIVTYVPKGQVWLEGDNESNSTDSRFYGPVPEGLIKSKVLCRLWPLEDIKMLS